jgi:2-hydroxychromene-2-carboxylate isomerase
MRSPKFSGAVAFNRRMPTISSMGLFMSRTLQYFLVPNSPWTYLGHDRLRQLAKQHGVTVEPLCIDLGGQVFPISGGLPLAQRAPQRQAYRLVELRRFRDVLGLPMNIQPKFFPVNPDLASRLVVAVQMADGPERSLDLTGALLRAVWAEERNIADQATLAVVLAEQGLAPELLAQARSSEVAAVYQANTQRAIEAQVFGAPSYVLEGELFWGQDRLDLLARALAG